MGNLPNINYESFPKQSNKIGLEVKVCFHYDTSKTLKGTVVRDDIEYPWVMIIHLSDNRFVLATECQYSYAR